jgi:Tfp pilus assembly protein PilN
MKAVNLLPRETRSSRSSSLRFDPLAIGGMAITAVVVAAIGGGFALAHSHASSEQQRLSAARSELAQLKAEETQSGAVSTPILPTPAVTGQAGTWKSALDSALAGRLAWDGVLSQIGRVTPPNVTFTNVTLGAAAASTATTTASAGTLSLSGSAFSHDAVAELLARLQLVPGLANVTLTSSTADPTSGVVTFVIAADASAPATSVAAPPTGAGA